jgi:FMN phosphatase YigB (HAD superfamily)
VADDLLLVVDFDGTLYRGDEPVRFYARRLASALPEADGAALLASFERYLEQGPKAAADSRDTVEAAALREAVDGWGAAVHLGQRVYGIPPGVVDRAFVDTRAHMVESACELEPAEPLLDTLRLLGGRVRRVLATNSPDIGLDVLLRRIGADGLFDEIVCSLGKPDGLRRYLQRELGQNPGGTVPSGTVPSGAALGGAVPGGAVPDGRAARYPAQHPAAWRLFSVGDHYRNEIEPAVEIGARAGFVDRFGRRDGPATAVAPTVEGVLPALLAWARDPRRTIEDE